MAAPKDPLLDWAKKATAGLDDSKIMMGILDDRGGRARLEFELQIGHCLLAGKPLVLLIPVGVDIPEKLRAAATVVETYRLLPDGEMDPESMHLAASRAFHKLGLERKH